MLLGCRFFFNGYLPPHTGFEARVEHKQSFLSQGCFASYQIPWRLNSYSFCCFLQLNEYKKSPWIMKPGENCMWFAEGSSRYLSWLHIVFTWEQLKLLTPRSLSAAILKSPLPVCEPFSSFSCHAEVVFRWGQFGFSLPTRIFVMSGDSFNWDTGRRRRRGRGYWYLLGRSQWCYLSSCNTQAPRARIIKMSIVSRLRNPAFSAWLGPPEMETNFCIS